MKGKCSLVLSPLFALIYFCLLLFLFIPSFLFSFTSYPLSLSSLILFCLCLQLCLLLSHSLLSSHSISFIISPLLFLFPTSLYFSFFNFSLFSHFHQSLLSLSVPSFISLSSLIFISLLSFSVPSFISLLYSFSSPSPPPFSLSHISPFFCFFSPSTNVAL